MMNCRSRERRHAANKRMRWEATVSASMTQPIAIATAYKSQRAGTCRSVDGAF